MGIINFIITSGTEEHVFNKDTFKEEKPDYLKLAKQALFADIKRKGLSEEEACRLMKIKNYTVLKEEKRPFEIKGYHNLIKAS